MSSTSKILITGAGTGFGKLAALELAAQGHQVIATVEIPSQVSSLKQAAKDKGIELQIEKLDVTVPADHIKAWEWDIDVLINNAGISEGGSTVDIPLAHIRQQFEVNVFGPIGLTQGFAKQMIAKQKGRIIFISSIAGITTDPFTGTYSASKHAVEAFAEALNKETKEFGIQVATINPGPFFTGFNDRMFETWKEWEKPVSENVFDYSKLAFPHEQYDPAEVIEKIIGVVNGTIDTYRNIVPEKSVPQIKTQMDEVWDRKQNKPVAGTQDPLVQKAYEMEPEQLAK